MLLRTEWSLENESGTCSRVSMTITGSWSARSPRLRSAGSLKTDGILGTRYRNRLKEPLVADEIACLYENVGSCRDSLPILSKPAKIENVGATVIIPVGYNSADILRRSTVIMVANILMVISSRNR